MSVALNQSRASRGLAGRLLPWVGMGLCFTVMAGHAAYDLLGPMRSHFGSRGPALMPGPNQGPAATADVPASRSTVSLSERKFQEARITTERARIDHLTTEVGVNGSIQSNADMKVAIRPWAAGIIREVHAVIGQHVKKGDTLVVLDSPEIGTARLNLRARQRELLTARFDAAWKSEVAGNVAALVPELRKEIHRRSEDLGEEHHESRPAHPERKRDDSATLERRFADKQLGAYRGTLLQALADYDIAAHEEEKTASLRHDRIQGVHPMIVALHTRQGAQGTLEGKIEQVSFDAAHGKRLADQDLHQAEGAVIDAAQRLRILGVPEDVHELLTHPEKANLLALDEDVTAYRILVPFDGSIITKNAVTSQKADMNEALFTLADLRTVWVTAEVPESDLAKLPRLHDGTFRITAAAYPGREFQARLLSVGASVDPLTRTVSIRAQAENPENLLKVGMFVRVLLDSSARVAALTVPTSAVVEIDALKYVFVPSDKDNPPGHRNFALKPVELGREAGDRVVVNTGLKADDQIVASGAFFLKSELILQNDKDEEE